MPIFHNVRVTDKAGNEVKHGDTVTDFRGDTAVFGYVSGRGRTGTWKVVGDWMGERNANVFGLTVEEVAEQEG